MLCPTAKVLDEVSPAVKRKLAEFHPPSGEDAIRKREYEQIREPYSRQPDSAGDADNWSSAEDWDG
jgi:hypothetical protein